MSAAERIRVAEERKTGTPEEWLEDHEVLVVEIAELRKDCLHASDEIDELLAEIERLQRELAEARAAWLRFGDQASTAEDRCVRLEAALRAIADPTNHHHKPGWVPPERVAREALEETGGSL